MFVVKRPFRNFGKVLTVGSVITEPTAIKRFKGRLAEGKIIEVTEQTYSVAAKYFKDKYGVVLPAICTEPTDEVKTDEVKTDEVKATPAKAVAKAVAK